MTGSTVWINGQRLGEYKGGYTPFSFEPTPHLNFGGDNLLAVNVDSTERGHSAVRIPIDYFTFGGIVELAWNNGPDRLRDARK